MKIHEHQGKDLFKRFGIPVPRGQVAFSVDEAVAAADALGGDFWVVKAQIHAGGRGKGGGVKLARSKAEVRELAGEILGMNLITQQTGPEGKIVKRLYIEEGADIQDELYLGMLVDRATNAVTIMVSTEGGTEIEEVAEHNPSAIHKIHVNAATGVLPFQVRNVAKAMGMSGKLSRSLTSFVHKLYTCFTELDCSMAEINPLIVTSDQKVVALDAKLSFDSNAMFRHKDLAELRDLSEEEPSEIKASEFDLSYIKLDGDIGCLVNGAGLAMATMDILKHCGGEPANFLDVGGSATTERVTEAFKILIGDNVNAIFVNIFGGIMKCDTIANGLIAAHKTLGLKVPLIVRLEGTNVELGKTILRESGLTILAADSMADGAVKAVDAARKHREG